MKPGKLRAVRWTSAAIVFQGRCTRSTRCSASATRSARRSDCTHAGRARTRQQVGELLELVGCPRAARRISAPALRRSAPAGADRAGAGLRAELLIADEPTTALDVMVQAQVLRLLEDLQSDLGLAVIFITHDLSMLASACERIAVMYAGRIVEEGPSKAVFADPLTRTRGRSRPRFRSSATPPIECIRPACPVIRPILATCPRLPVSSALPAGDRRVPVHDGRALAARVRIARPACVHARPPVATMNDARCSRCATSTSSSATRGGTRAGRRWRQPRDGYGRGRRPRRRVGLRQDHAGPHDRWAAAPKSGEVRFAATAASRPARAARAPAHGADGLPGPDRRAEPAPDDLRGGGGGRAHPEGAGRRGAARGRRAVATPACARPSASSPATRTSSPAASASA